MRSVAIVHVVLFHVLHGIIRFVPQQDLPAVLSRYPLWMNFTWQLFGVYVIFMVSAYLLSLGLIQNLDQTGTIDIRSYYIRRVSRIIPLYYVAIIIFAVAQKDTLSDVFLAASFVQFLLTGKAIVPVGRSMVYLPACNHLGPDAPKAPDAMALHRHRYQPRSQVCGTGGTNPVIRGPWAMISCNIMGIYLFHMPLILVGAIVAFRSTQPDALAHATVWQVWGVFAVATLLSLGLSAVLNRFIEAPIQMALRRKMGL